MLLQKLEYVVLGTGTVCAGGSALLIAPASIFTSSLHITYAQETRHAIVRKPVKRVTGGERADSILLQSSILISILLKSSILIDFEGSIFATD